MLDTFWGIFPIGSRLTLPFIIQRLDGQYIFFANAASAIFIFIQEAFRTWPESHLPIIGDVREQIQHLTDIPKFAFRVVIRNLKYAGLIVLLALLTVLGTLAAVSCLMLVVLCFFAWFALYRIPIYSLLYPRIALWALRNNSKVYHPLQSPSSSDSAPIRMIRLHAGKPSDAISCTLFHGDLNSADYDALSYVWGISLFPRKIIVNGKPFYVTSNLHTVLRELRQPAADKVFWIDAICIHQFDNEEKSTQVQLMRRIYSNAKEVIIWLGPGSKSNEIAFDAIAHVGKSEIESRNAAWKEQVAAPSWRQVVQGIDGIFSNDWWTRAWITQEAVVGRIVVVRKGSCQVSWEEFDAVISLGAFWDCFPYVGVGFARSVEEMRSEARADLPMENATNTDVLATQDNTGDSVKLLRDAFAPGSLLDLVFRFRRQAASFGSDKIYSLLGLVTHSSAIQTIPDYSASVERVFLDFTIACLQNEQNLSVIALASGAAIQGTSWCRDWALTNDGQFPTKWFSLIYPNRKTFAASGDHAAVFEVDVMRRVLAVQGYEADRIIKIGDFGQVVLDEPKDWTEVLLKWERVAGGPWSSCDHVQWKGFNRTITADWWPGDVVDWRKELEGFHDGAPELVDDKYTEIVDDACGNRRFFVTESGRFGLGPWNIKPGDLVCVLLGSAVPFILRRTSLKAQGVASAPGVHGGGFFNFMGEGYVDGLMHDEENATRIQSRDLRFYNLI